MRFGVWFRLWQRSFYAFILCGLKSRKSKRKMRCKHRSALKIKNRRYDIDRQRSRKIKEGIRRRKPNFDAFVRATAFFTLSIAMIVLLPFAAADWIAKSTKKRRSIKKRTTVSAVSKTKNLDDKTQPVSQKCDFKAVQSTEVNKKTAEKHIPNVVTGCDDKTEAEIAKKRSALIDGESVTLSYPPHKIDDEISEYAPLHKEDKPIAKRMIAIGISGAQTVYRGEYFKIELEEGAVLLKCSEKAFAKASESDSVFLSVSLTLGRKIYGVIVSEISADNGVNYEYDAWFDES